MMQSVEMNGINTVAAINNMKADVKNAVIENDTNEVKTAKELLSNPMETVGRSQVQFRGIKQLPKNDLNILSEYIAKIELPEKDIKPLKEAITKALNEYKCDNIEQMAKKLKDLDSYINCATDIINNTQKIDKNVNTGKITTIVGMLLSK